jgi:hypothetical protein
MGRRGLVPLFMQKMKEQTIYSYKLLYRFRWHFAGLVLQILLLGVCLGAASLWLSIAISELLVSLSILAAIPILHAFLFRFYLFTRSLTADTVPNMLFSPWWGAGTRHPMALSHYRGAESTVIAGSLLFAAALFVWLPLTFSVCLLCGTVVFAIPRLLALLMSLPQPKHCRVKYEMASVAFLLTDG